MSSMELYKAGECGFLCLAKIELNTTWLKSMAAGSHTLWEITLVQSFVLFL